MSMHEQFADDLALHALGALQGEERSTLEKHLEGCAGCRGELEKLRGDSALLALSVAGPKPPQRSKERLMKAIAQDQKVTEQNVKAAAPRRGWWGLMPWALAAAAAFVAFLLVKQNDIMREQLTSLTENSASQQIQLQQARDVVETLTATDAVRVTLVAGKNPPQPQGKAIYQKDRARLLFLASNMPPLPAQKVYELWVIPTTGAPIPAGTFKTDAHGSATVVHPPLPLGTEAKAFAVTVEPEGGSATPTMPIVMIGTGE